MGLYIAYCVRAVLVAYYLLTNELGTSALLQSGRLLCNIDVLICKFYSQLPSLLSTIEGTFLNIFGTETAFLYFFCITGHILYATACYKLGMEFAGRPLGGLVCYAITIASSVPSGSLGYGFYGGLWFLSPGLVFQAAGIFALSFVLAGQIRLASLIAGLLTNFHPVIGAIIFSFLVATCVSAPRRMVYRLIAPAAISWFAPCLSPIAQQSQWLTLSKHLLKT